MEAMTCFRESPRPFSPGIVRPCTFVAITSSSRERSFGEDPARDHLALAEVVDIGRVEERDPALDSPPDDRLCLRLGQRPRPLLDVAEAHHPETEARHAQAGVAEVDVAHLPSP